MTRGNIHSISNRKFCCFSCIIAMVHQNSPTVEFWWDNIQGNLRRPNTEPSMDFRRANTELSQDFRKANMEPSVHFRRANTENYWKQNVNLSKRVRKDGVFLGLAGLLLGISLRLCPWEIPRSSPAIPWKTPSFPPILLRLLQYTKYPSSTRCLQPYGLQQLKTTPNVLDAATASASIQHTSPDFQPLPQGEGGDIALTAYRHSPRLICHIFLSKI